MKLALLAVAGFLSAGVSIGAWYVAQTQTAAEAKPEPTAEVTIVDPTYQPAKPSCASCGDARHPTAPLYREEFDRLIAQYAVEPVDASEALDALCYYGIQTRTMLEIHGHGDLDDKRREFLNRELARTHVYMSLRVIDENGVVRVEMKERKIPLDVRDHHPVDTAVNVAPPEISGTFKRVGLYHIWARF